MDLKILVRSERHPVAHAINLALELEDSWDKWCAELAAKMTRDLERIPNPRELEDHGARIIAERIKWTLQSVVSAEPAAQSINDLITGAADRARAGVLEDVARVKDRIMLELGAPFAWLTEELEAIATRHAVTPRAG